MNRSNRTLLSCVYWSFVLYVFVPLILMILMGFKDSKFIGFPIRSWTLDWYVGVFSDAEVLSTLGNRGVVDADFSSGRNMDCSFARGT